MKLQALPLHTVSLRCASRFSTPVVYTAEIEQRSRRRVVNGISCCALAIATALLVGCGGSGSDSGSSSGILSGGNSISSGSRSGSRIGTPQQPSAPPQEPSTTIQIPIAPQPPSAPIQEPSTSIQEPSAPIEEPSPPPEELGAPVQEPSTAQCGSGMAARDLSGQCRASPPTPGALEAIDGTNVAI